MGTIVSGQATGTKVYTKNFSTNPWGGKTETFTAPAGVSEIKLTAVAVGGCIAGSATTCAIDQAGQNTIFARLNGVDPPFLCSAYPSADYLRTCLSGKYVYGSVINSDEEVDGINGLTDLSSTGRMNGSFFNALDSTPWGISISQGVGASQVISSTKDGFNFTHNTLTTSNNPVLYSCVFGGDGKAMIAIGATENLYYTQNYGATWVNLSGVSIPATKRLRYLNGYWILIWGGVTFKYTANPLSASGQPVAWSTSQTLGTETTDIGWTGTTGIVTSSNSTNVQTSPWASGAAPSGAWSLQAHGGDLAFDVCETGSNGEIVVLKRNTQIASGTSIRATSGDATTWNSVNVYAIRSAQSFQIETVKYIPMTSGSMWVMVGYNSAYVYSTTSAVTPTMTELAIAGISAGNALTNGTVINNLQFLGGNYCSLSSANGLGKYSAAGVITASLLRTAAQLTTEFDYTSTVTKAPDFVISRGGLEVLRLEGGGTATAGSGGKGGGGNFMGGSTYGSKMGLGPTGMGGVGSTTPASMVSPQGNGGFVGNVNSVYSGGGTWSYNDYRYHPAPNSLIPGASGAYYAGANNVVGGGGSLFATAGSGYTGASYSSPAAIFAHSQKIGQYGGGANGVQTLTSTYRPAGGGAQGCYEYVLSCSPGDVFTLELPGCCYVNANGTTGTNGGPGGESYAIITYEV